MVADDESNEILYKVKLNSGRVLGPLDLNRIRQLILKNHIVGMETARRHPSGEWTDINEFPEILDLLVQKISGTLEPGVSIGSDGSNETRVLPGSVGSTVVLNSESGDVSLPEVDEAEEATGASPTGILPELDDSDEKTRVDTSEGFERETSTAGSESAEDDSDKTMVDRFKPVEVQGEQDVSLMTPVDVSSTDTEMDSEIEDSSQHNLSQEKTVFFQRSTDGKSLPGKKKQNQSEKLKKLITPIAIIVMAYMFLMEDEPPAKPKELQIIRPQLPEYIKGKGDIKQSMKFYNEALRYYVWDNVEGYRLAAENFRKASAYDSQNVKALAFLASSYLNLIDSSNKDENYFFVLSKLIEMSRAKQVDLQETVIADVEFYLVTNKVNAAQSRLVDYTKSHEGYGLELFYYLALTFFQKADYKSAARYLSLYPDSKVFSAKVFYLKGQLAERLGDKQAALTEYQKAIKFFPEHAKSHLRIADLLSSQGEIKEASPNIDFVMANPHLLAPKPLALGYYLNTLLSELHDKQDLALASIERAVKLDPENHDYLLEMYTLRAKAGESLAKVQKQARMYYFLGEGEKLIKQGRFQEALVPLLQARQANDASPIPAVKIGDMFNNLNDIENAKVNYRIASERAPEDITVWSKYIQSLIESYEWEEAKKAMDRFRKLPVSQSAIDKAAADMYQMQGRPVEAQTLYRKAMSRRSIDSSVYLAYAKSLMSIKEYAAAPLFFSLALRFDPLNTEAVINIAKCISETDSIEKAIEMLKNELETREIAAAKILTAIAELQMKKGDYAGAQLSVNQAKRADPNYAYSWKVQAQIYLNDENVDKKALDRALIAFKSFSERNPSDPSGYLERYKIFLKKTMFEDAKTELNEVFRLFPKYPNLHYYMGALYSVQGNHKAAAEEFRNELENNESNPKTLIAYGKALLELGAPAEANTYFTKAMTLVPGSSEARQNAGWANFMMKNYQAAVSLIRAAIAIDSGNPLLYKRLGLVFQSMGDANQACQAFRQYIQREPDAPDKANYQDCF